MDAGKLWTAPEILRENNPPLCGTQKGDVFSYAIVCYEIMMRSEPYNLEETIPRGSEGSFIGTVLLTSSEFSISIKCE